MLVTPKSAHPQLAAQEPPGQVEPAFVNVVLSQVSIFRVVVPPLACATNCTQSLSPLLPVKNAVLPCTLNAFAEKRLSVSLPNAVSVVSTWPNWKGMVGDAPFGVSVAVSVVRIGPSVPGGAQGIATQPLAVPRKQPCWRGGKGNVRGGRDARPFAPPPSVDALQFVFSDGRMCSGKLRLAVPF